MGFTILVILFAMASLSYFPLLHRIMQSSNKLKKNN